MTGVDIEVKTSLFNVLDIALSLDKSLSLLEANMPQTPSNSLLPRTGYLFNAAVNVFGAEGVSTLMSLR